MPTTDFLKQAAGVASYYGFIPLEKALSKYKDRKKKRSLDLKIPITTDIFSKELCSLMKSCANSRIVETESPVQFYHVRTQRNSNTQTTTPRKHRVHFGLTILGVEKSVAEALILKSALAILEESGMGGGQVHINSIGDKDSIQRFTHELGIYLRKNINDMPAPGREALKQGAFAALEVLTEKRHPIAENAPRPMQFLSDASRRHLKEVLEFLEITDTSYKVNDKLIGNSDYYSQTLFEIRQHEQDSQDGTENRRTVTLARGGRCDDFTRRLFHTNLPIVSIILEHEGSPTRSAWSAPRVRRPKVYFVQLGARAKLQGLAIIEVLRQARIPLHQAIGSDSLSTQLEEARLLKVSYSIIMGQREALDGTVIVRDMNTHTQAIIPTEELAVYLKTMQI